MTSTTQELARLGDRNTDISVQDFIEIDIGVGCYKTVRDLSGPVLRGTARLSQRYPHIARYGFFGVST